MTTTWLICVTVCIKPFSLDKYLHAECITRKQQLGLIVDTHLMIVEFPEDKRAKIAEKLCHWHSKRGSFTVLDAAQLVGQLEHAATVAPWLRFLMTSLRHSILNDLRANRAKVYKDNTMDHYLEDAVYKGKDFRGLLRKNFADSKIAQKIWHCKQRAVVIHVVLTKVLIHGSNINILLILPLCFILFGLNW